MGAPKYPTNVNLGCYRLNISSSLHERLLVNGVLAVCFVLFFAGNLWNLIRWGCVLARRDITPCGELEFTNVLGFLVLLLYTGTIGYCVRHINRLDPILNISEVIWGMDRQTDLLDEFNVMADQASTLAERIRGEDFLRNWPAVQGCIDELAMIDTLAMPASDKAEKRVVLEGFLTRMEVPAGASADNAV